MRLTTTSTNFSCRRLQYSTDAGCTVEPAQTQGTGVHRVGQRLGSGADMPFMRRLLVATAVLVAIGASAPAPGSGALFSSYAAMTLRLKAPFNDLFERARQDETYAVIGTLSYADEAGREIVIDPVKITLRGHTSVRESECVFPKLKLRFDESASRDPVFGGIRTVKIGTHCGEAGDEALTARFGRLANEHSPLREAFVYRLLDTLGVPSLKARPARITYVYADGRRDEDRRSTQTLVRNAMLLEDDDAALKRLGVKEIDEPAFTSARETFRAEDSARLAFAEALIGNFDWCLKFDPDDQYRCDARHPLWNVMAVQTSDGRTIPAIYDFDVSGMVAGRHQWFANVYNESFLASRSHPAIEVLGQVQRTRTLFPRAVLDATRAEFVRRKADAYRAFDDAPLDALGRQRIREYLDSFFAAIESDETFYRPVVTTRGVMTYTTPDRTAAACPERGAIPVGTPVSEPQAARGDMIQVVVLDALWHWAPPHTCPEIHEGAVWIERSAIGKNFPER